MHNLAVFVIFLGILSVLGLYMFRERPYIQVEDSENVQLHCDRSRLTLMEVLNATATQRGLFKRRALAGAGPKGVETALFERDTSI